MSKEKISEDILARIIKTVDGYMPRSGDWHSELLYVSSRKTPRPFRLQQSGIRLT